MFLVLKKQIKVISKMFSICYFVQVSLATHYVLDGSGIESRCGKIFRTRSDRLWGPPSLLYNEYRVSSPGVKAAGRGVNHPLKLSVEVKERVELYLYSPSGP
jgi:hypothetical protein